MKRRTKLFLLLTSLLCLVGVGVVLRKIQQNAASPFPSAIVVLDDASWKLRERTWDEASIYLWAAPDVIFYQQKIAGRYQLMRRHIAPDKMASVPSNISITLAQNQSVESLSPDGTTLCIYTETTGSHYVYHLIRIDSSHKPVVIKAKSSQLLWSPDSRCLYGIESDKLTFSNVRYDTQTGAAAKTVLDTKFPLELKCVTLEGKLLSVDDEIITSSASQKMEWQVREIRGRTLVPVTYHRRSLGITIRLVLSPDGRRLLWRIADEEITSWEKWQQKLFRKQMPPHEVIRWQVTDIDSKNEQEIGIVPKEQGKEGELEAQWTPDSKGVHFVQDGKLMYLAVP